jgi:hypothetical protein
MYRTWDLMRGILLYPPVLKFLSADRNGETLFLMLDEASNLFIDFLSIHNFSLSSSPNIGDKADMSRIGVKGHTKILVQKLERKRPL